MQRIVWRSAIVLLATFCILCVSGCGKKGVVVKGKVKFPKNMTVTGDQLVTVGFNPTDKNLLASSAACNSDDQTFEARGFDGKGVTPGKYKISISIVEVPKAGSVSKEQMLKKLEYENFSKKYAPDDSPLSFEITPSTSSITIDLEAGTVTAG